MAFAIMIVISSCDSKKSEIKEIAKRFVTALNEQDRITVYEIYPAAKQLMDLLPESIETKGIKVSVDDSTGIYTVILNSERDQRIVFKTDSIGSFKIEDSYGILQFDSISREFAVRAGIPIKQFSDRMFAEIMNEDSLFMSTINLKYFNELHGNLVKETGYWSWGRESGNVYMKVFQTIKNRGNVAIKGDDYNIEFRLSDNLSGVTTTKVAPGIDLAPGEIYEFVVNAPAFYNAAYRKNMYSDIVIRFKNMSKAAMLLKYAKLTGEEYQEYLKMLKEIEESRNNPSEEESSELPDDFDSLPDED